MQVRLCSRLTLDPGVAQVPPLSIKPNLDSAVETSRTPGRGIAPIRTSPLNSRATSDSLLYTHENGRVSPRKNSSGLFRTNAQIYQRVPLLLQIDAELPLASASQIVGARPDVSDVNKEIENMNEEVLEFVCGLPCQSPRKKQELVKALSILEGRGPLPKSKTASPYDRRKM